MADDLTLELEHGRLTISREAVAEIVAETALASYGVVGLSAGSRVGRMFRREGISVDGSAAALRIELHVVVEHGLNLAEVAATVRSQVAYEVARLTGLAVASVEVVIQRVRQSA
ncbi:MAG TPA: Asp23/Gls24 family envelope stress response protein [Gaiellaceae bacterium]